MDLEILEEEEEEYTSTSSEEIASNKRLTNIQSLENISEKSSS